MKLLLMYLLVMVLLFGSGVEQHFKKLKKRYCIKPKESQERLCLLSEIEFPYSYRVTDIKAKELIASKLKRFIEDFKREDLEKELKKELDGESFSFGGEWEKRSTLSIYSVLSRSVTLEEQSYLYLGGVHGLYSINFLNFALSGKKIVLEDLVANLKGFQEEVESYYREYFGIPKGQPLSKYDWFEDRFTLAKEFAIDSNGILFVYNLYEIKPFAGGFTELLVPYIRIKKYLKSQYIPKLSNQEKHQLDENITLQLQKASKQILEIDIKVNAPKNAKRAWVSISLPKIYAKRRVKVIKQRGFKRVSLYPKGAKIYNKELKRAVPSNYLLIEGYARNIKEGDTLSMRLKVAANSKGFIDIRAVFDKSEIPQFSQIFGQQGYANYRVYYQLK